MFVNKSGENIDLDIALDNFLESTSIDMYYMKILKNISERK